MHAQVKFTITIKETLHICKDKTSLLHQSDETDEQPIKQANK